MPPWTDRVSRLVMGAMLTACTVGVVHADPVTPPCETDNRCQAVRNFFLRYQSPLEKLAHVFMRAADSHKLDYRLLPALAMAETTGGLYGTPTNVFGWNSGRTKFASIEAGILYVAGRFATSPIYAGRTALEILRNYNPARKSYPPKVTKYMLEISPEAVQ